METQTDALRRAAPSWSLADDKRLLDALQKMHDALLTKCNDTSGQLSTMCNDLTDAALALDNVNNRFMSLSNSQFVERRVYDDDGDVTAPADGVTSQKTTEQPATTAESTAENIKRALKVLENMHESVVILADSDSDSGSEGDEDIDRVVFKPKDVYRERPLPHVIGTAAWKSKWHAGVLPDNSASESEDSDASRRFDRYSDNERYSPESEAEHDVTREARPALRDEMSISSSEVTSERDAPPAPGGAATLSPADVAAELARRLQGARLPVQPPQAVTEESPAQEVPRKLYKPEIPPPGTIFPDEPPPLDSDHDDDIFAELRKSKPYPHSNAAQNSVAKDLFGVRGTDDIDDGSDEDGDIFSDLVPGVNKSKPTAEVKGGVSPSVTTRSAPATPAPPTDTVTPERDEQHTNKKPVGGISMFGGGQHSAIGAAILQRQRQAASGDDTDGSDVTTAPKQTTYKPENKEENENEKEKTHRDIFEDLFSKSEKVTKKKVVQDPIAKKNVVEKKEMKVDLFSDNIFDDIDDIFTSNIISKVPIKEDKTKNNEKSLFDDEDDLFRDIAVSNTSAKQDKITVENQTITKDKTVSIFDSDDDLFSEKTLQKGDQYTNQQNNSKINKASETSSDTITSKDTTSYVSESSKDIFDSDKDFFVEKKPNTKLMEAVKDTQTVQIRNETKNVFDDSDDDIFSGLKAAKGKEITTKTQSDENGAKSKIIPTAKGVQDEIILKDDDNLFKDKSASVKTEQINNEKKDIFEDDADLFKIYPKTEVKQFFANLNKKSSKEIINNMKVVEEKPQISSKQSTENISESEEIKNVQSQAYIDVLNKSDSHKSTEEKRVVPEIHKENAQYEIRNSDNIEVKSEVAKNRLDVQFNNDDLDVCKTVTAKDMKPEMSSKPILETAQDVTENLKKEEKIPSVIEEIPVVTAKDVKPETHQKPTLKIDQGATKKFESNKNIQKVSEVIDNAKIYKDKVDNMKVVDSNKNITSNVTIDAPTTTLSDSKLNTPDIFSEVLNDQPPVFEKPKEPKRSKNINALFDDDSDDEALFYRKSDATLDDVPSVDRKDSISDDRFQLFLDEPPAIDEDFEQNTNKKNNESSLEYTSLFKDISSNRSDVGGIEISRSVNLLPVEINSKNTENINKVKSTILHEKLEFRSTDTKSKDSDDELFTPKPESVDVEQTYIKMNDDLEQTTVTKKIGKLKPMNLNINVNSLLPGASPKKTIKTQEQIDGQKASPKKPIYIHEQIDGQTVIKSTEDLNSKVIFDDKKIEPSLVQSISFDGDPDSTVLDNKLSKGRAKINVKRRPSSRRARHEAARKSGIDFGQDSTDNSSSIDDLLKSTESTDNSHLTIENKDDNLDSITCDSLAEDSKTEAREEIIQNFIPANENRNESLESKYDDKKELACSDQTTKEDSIKPELIPQASPPGDTKSKVVYILNDEDIFSETKPQKSSEVASKPKTLNIVDDDDDIFKSITPATKVENVESITEATAIKTLGNVYKVQIDNNESDDDIFKDKQNFKKVSKPKASITDLEKLEVKSGEVLSKVRTTGEIIPKKVTDVKSNPKKSIFDDLSDEENELFNSKSKQALPEKRLDKNVVFDTDSEGELFSGKSKKETKDLGSAGKKKIKRVEVKGSLFGDDDDDDLFGAKSKTASSILTSSSSSRSESGVQPRSSTTDPLSALLDPQ